VIGLGYAPLPLGPAIAFYTVLNRCRPRTCVFSCVLALVAITISQLQPGHNEPYDLVVAVLIFVAAGMAGVLSRTRRAYLEETEARAARAEAERDRESARSAAAERARIARELHDVVAHHVSLMAVQAEAAASLLPGRPAQARESVEIIGDTARQALAELRRLLGVLRGPAEEIETEPSPSLSELGAVLDQVRAAGLPVEFRTGGQPGSLAPGVELTAYRIVQEALTNTLKHARASQAVVTLDYEPGFVTVTVANSDPDAAVSVPAAPAVATRSDGVDGVGRAVGSRGIGGSGRVSAFAGARSGFGLAGIAERVASCGGSLSAGPAPDGGFAVTARLPAR
jgi:signal transduction histidine kinase